MGVRVTTDTSQTAAVLSAVLAVMAALAVRKWREALLGVAATREVECLDRAVPSCKAGTVRVASDPVAAVVSTVAAVVRETVAIALGHRAAVARVSLMDSIARSSTTMIKAFKSRFIQTPARIPTGRTTLATE